VEGARSCARARQLHGLYNNGWRGRVAWGEGGGLALLSPVALSSTVCMCVSKWVVIPRSHLHRAPWNGFLRAAPQEVTKREFVSPLDDLTLRLEGLLALNLHEFIADVEDITDQAVKEAKMETTLNKLKDTWGPDGSVHWVVEKYKVRGVWPGVRAEGESGG
jgi:hypothetical protein